MPEGAGVGNPATVAANLGGAHKQEATALKADALRPEPPRRGSEPSAKSPQGEPARQICRGE